MANDFFGDSCKELAREFKSYVDSIVALTDAEKAKILEYFGRIEHVARADGSLQALTGEGKK